MEHLNAKTQEMHIEYTNRPTYHSVNQVCSAEGHLRLGINANRVDQCIGGLMNVLQGYSSDVVITAVGVVCLMILQRFQFTVGSFFGFIENFMRGDDYKYNCHAMQRMIGTLYRDHLTRYERVDFKHTRTIKF